MTRVHHYTYADYLVCSDTYGDELINGTLYVREPPGPSPVHQWIAGEIYLQIATALKGKAYRVCIAPFDVRLPKADEPDDQVDTVVQPDIFIVSDLQKVDARGMRGAPDWLAEVLSPSTTHRDQLVKLPAYERAGVREVWLVNPRDRIVTIYHLDAGHYGPATILELKGQTQIAAVPCVTIDWNQVLAQI